MKPSINSQNVEHKKNNESSNIDLTFFMEQEDDIYATLDDRDSITSDNMNSFNKNVYIRNDEVLYLFKNHKNIIYLLQRLLQLDRHSTIFISTK